MSGIDDSGNEWEISGTTRVVGLIGYPATYSLSPAIHNAAYRAMGIDARYVVFPVQGDAVREAVAAIRALNLVGVSVTVPHKSAVVEYVDELTSAASRLSSVNWISNNDGTLVGDSTDGEGFLRALAQMHGVDVTGRHVAVLGAGGAARAIVGACVDAGCGQVTVMNRTQSAAIRLAELSPVIRVGSAPDVVSADVVVNATSVGMDGALVDEMPIDPSLLQPSQVVMDLVYSPNKTRLYTAARARGCEVSNGLGMLVHQAAAQIERWTGKPAPIDTMMRVVAPRVDDTDASEAT